MNATQVETQVLSEVKSLETLPPSGKAALSSPVEIDYYQLVERLSRKKNGKDSIGVSFVGKKGQQGLFALTCKYVKSIRPDLIKETKEGDVVKGCFLPADIEAKIREAIADFWKVKSLELLNYGEVVGYSYDKPVAIMTDEMVCEGVKLTATLKAERSPKSLFEERLNLRHLEKQAQKQLNNMTGIPDEMGHVVDTGRFYSPEDIRTQQAKVAGISQRIFLVSKMIADVEVK